MAGPDLLRTGIYAVSEAASLIGVSPTKIRGWIDGWPGTTRAPIVENEIGWLDGRLAFSFANLMELRFIAFFEGAGVKLREIRMIMDEVRREINRPRPFATNTVFKTDGEKIVAETVRKNGHCDLYDLRSKNFEMGAIVYKSLKSDVVYDAQGNATAWFPRRDLAPNVIIHPSMAFGRPILNKSGIPTETIAEAWHAEGSIEAVADLFEVSKARVREALAFEKIIRRAA
jgi:uncharacterized protein (DUF433 family)/DNA-binding transcriptional MerR regulator